MLFMKYYPQILSLMSEIDKLNEKLDGFASKYLDNVAVGTAILFVIFGVCAWAIKLLSK